MANIRLGVVAGEFTNDICKYLEDRSSGSIDLSFKYSSLLSNKDKIMRGIIKLDKLVYIMANDQSVDLRGDMNLLGHLLDKDNSYFKVNEILVFVADCDIARKGLEYFQYVMTHVGFENYQVITCGTKVENNLIFRRIFNQKIGDEVRTKRKKVYRVEEFSETRKAYDIVDNEDMIIRPVNEGNIKEYDEMTKIAERFDSGNLLVDEKDNEIIHNDAILGRVNIMLSEDRKFVNIVSGESKSGISTYSSALAVSSYEAGKAVLVIDCSRHSGTTNMLKEFADNIDTLYCELNSVLCDEYNYKDYDFIVANCADISDKNVWINYVKFLISILPKIDPDVVVIDCDEEFLDSIVEYCNIFIQNIFIACQVLESDFNSSLHLIEEYKNNYNTIVWLNDCILNLDGYTVLTATDIQQKIKGVQIINPIEILDLNIDGELYDVLLDAEG